MTPNKEEALEPALREIVDSIRRETRTLSYLTEAGCAWVPLTVLGVVVILLGLLTGGWWAAAGLGVVAAAVMTLSLFGAAQRSQLRAMYKWGAVCVRRFNMHGRDKARILELLKAWVAQGDKEAASLEGYIVHLWPVELKKERERQAMEDKWRRDRDERDN